MRLFLGISLTEEAVNCLEDCSYGLADVRWSGAERLHLTLQFLGEIGAPTREEMIEVLQQIRLEPFALQIQGMGLWQVKANTGIIYAGIEKSPELLVLQKQIAYRLSHIGIQGRGKKYFPHITLARYSGEKVMGMDEYVSSQAEKLSCHLPVENFHLYSSQLHKDGSIYKILETFF
ncbi:MAG: RNA 2',3'-cyclic phosphodiesterase [Spirochaetota bacterium]